MFHCVPMSFDIRELFIPWRCLWIGHVLVGALLFYIHVHVDWVVDLVSCVDRDVYVVSVECVVVVVAPRMVSASFLEAPVALY